MADKFRPDAALLPLPPPFQCILCEDRAHPCEACERAMAEQVLQPEPPITGILCGVKSPEDRATMASWIKEELAREP